MSNLQAGGAPRPSCGTLKRKDGVVPAMQEPGHSTMAALCLRDNMINTSLTLLPNIPLDTQTCS